MNQAIQITLRNVSPSPLLSRDIREKCAALRKLHPRIVHCRVAVERASGQEGRAAAFRVCLQVGVPGRELVADHGAHVDPHLALRDAFEAMRRELRDDKEKARAR